MKKIYKYLVKIILIIILYLLLFPISVKINKTIDAVEISLDDKAFCQPVKVTIIGTYKWRLFGADTFFGDIKFDTYELTMKKTLTQVEKDNIPALTLQGGHGYLRYGEWMVNEEFGQISCKPLLSKFVVQVYEKTGLRHYSWSSADGHCIVAPAASREEALNVLKRFTKGSLPPYENWVD